MSETMADRRLPEGLERLTPCLVVLTRLETLQWPVKPLWVLPMDLLPGVTEVYGYRVIRSQDVTRPMIAVSGMILP
jgi:hypothetical protein